MAWPVSPSNGQQTTINGTVFQYDSANSVWNRVYTTINSGITSVGTVTASAQPNITSLGTLGSLNVNGLSNLSAVGNVTITGGSSGQYLQTNGAGGLSWATINSTAISNGTSNVAVTSSGGNVAVSVGGTSNVLIVTTNSVNVAGNLNTGTGNVTAGNASLGNLVTSNYFTGTLTTQAQPNITSVGTLINTTLGGANSLTGGNLVSANYFTGVLTTNAQPNITSVGTLANLNVTGNITSGANITSGNATLGNLVTANYFTGNGSLLTSITGANITGWAPNANIANTVVVAAQPNITSVSTSFSGLTLVANANISSTGSVSQISGANLVSASYLTGTLTTGAQPNITSVSTSFSGLTLVANGNITLSGTGSQITGANLVSATYHTGTLTTGAQPNITSVGTLTNLNVTNYVKVANIQDSTGTNAISTYYNSHAGDIGVTGNLSVGTGGTGNLSATNLTGTLTTGAQPNITSVSTSFSGLTLISNGNITMSGTGSQLTGANLVSATYHTGTLTTAVQPNITSVGTIVNLNATNANFSLLKYNETVIAGGNTSTSISPNVATGTIFNYTANNNFTFNGLTSAVAGTSVVVIITQDATGSRTLTSTMKFAGGIKTLSTAASSIDIISVFYDGTNYYASLAKGFA